MHNIAEHLNTQLHCCRNTQQCSITSQNIWILNCTAASHPRTPVSLTTPL